MRNVILLASATAALSVVMALPAMAGQMDNNYCKDGITIVQDADNNGYHTDQAGQHIKQGQYGAVLPLPSLKYKHVKIGNKWYDIPDGYFYSTVQKQDAKNEKDYASGGNQKIKQFQLGFLSSMCGPAQNQDADNISKGGWWNNQSIKQKQKAFVLFAYGTAQDQDAKNSTEHGSGNDQSIKQSQTLFALTTEGTAQDQDAQNKVVYGSHNDQSIKQSQTLGAGSTEGTVQSQSANNNVVGGSHNDQSISQTQGTVVLGGPSAH